MVRHLWSRFPTRLNCDILEVPLMLKRVAILGSTGSIGTSTLKIVEAYPELFEVVSLAAGSNLDLVTEQTVRWHPKVVSVATEEVAETLRERLKHAGVKGTRVISGEAGTVECATLPEVDFVVSAIVGVGGLKATYEAVKAGKSIGLANKETMVAAGELITAEARKQGKPILPIDSEHNAIHQAMRGGRLKEVERVWLTASGGPFLHTPKADFEHITVEQALNHPTWKMGRRITIDSATLMNKGFEVIEACRLFDLPASRVEVIVHPQSTIHSMVEFVDGSLLAQLSVTDMRLPILYAMTFPDRIPSNLKFPVLELKHLDFYPPDPEKFPCLQLAYEAAEKGGTKSIALNAADEVAVAAFLEGGIPFNDIPATIRHVLDETPEAHPESIDQVLSADAAAREIARKHIQELRSSVVGLHS
ncbi:1-deoxy-D-xylulose 5-phosphate reductoisomerase [Candidatus Koribacter versatilis Ellin345]|uniref:1-deoxy-D-xylulose 5-phosphate reductoisomerase n=1 Tax=Koribacter versatilis (strain Ellin345) TaxID=204669 RepID=Q1IRS9_KORVE|nr:1-deoxy-D-xylulose 5-phosphate reductoisomerase [Candidatus Koribacter versatilis Ellin345]